MNRFKVRLHSTPSPVWTFYEGAVTVVAEDEDDAKAAAVMKLRLGAFPERPASSWVIDRVEQVK